MTIRNKMLFWFLFPTISIAVVLTAFCYYFTKKTIEQNIYDQLEIAADTMYINIDLFLKGKRGRAIDFCSDAFIRDCTEDITKKEDSVQVLTEQLNNHLTTNKLHLDPDILQIFIADLDGYVIGSTDINHLHRDVSGSSYFSETIKKGTHTTNLLYFSESGHGSYFDVANLLLNNGKQKFPIGMIVLRFSGDSLRRLTYNEVTKEFKLGRWLEGLGETGELYIVNSDTLMITESRFAEGSRFSQTVNTEGVKGAFLNRKGITGIYPGYRDIPVLGVSRYFEEMD